MTYDWIRDVGDFHKATGDSFPAYPHLPPMFQQQLRSRLIREEAAEVINAITFQDLVEIADGIVDCIYVLLGTAISYGIDIRPIWDAVHKANMSKVTGPRDSGGKQMKPPGWEPPPVAEIIETQIAAKKPRPQS